MSGEPPSIKLNFAAGQQGSTATATGSPQTSAMSAAAYQQQQQALLLQQQRQQQLYQQQLYQQQQQQRQQQLYQQQLYQQQQQQLYQQQQQQALLQQQQQQQALLQQQQQQQALLQQQQQQALLQQQQLEQQRLQQQQLEQQRLQQQQLEQQRLQQQQLEQQRLQQQQQQLAPAPAAGQKDAASGTVRLTPFAVPQTQQYGAYGVGRGGVYLAPVLSPQQQQALARYQLSIAAQQANSEKTAAAPSPAVTAAATAPSLGVSQSTDLSSTSTSFSGSDDTDSFLSSVQEFHSMPSFRGSEKSAKGADAAASGQKSMHMLLQSGGLNAIIFKDNPDLAVAVKPGTSAWMKKNGLSDPLLRPQHVARANLFSPSLAERAAALDRQRRIIEWQKAMDNEPKDAKARKEYFDELRRCGPGLVNYNGKREVSFIDALDYLKPIEETEEKWHTFLLVDSPKSAQASKREIGKWDKDWIDVVVKMDGRQLDANHFVAHFCRVMAYEKHPLSSVFLRGVAECKERVQQLEFPPDHNVCEDIIEVMDDKIVDRMYAAAIKHYPDLKSSHEIKLWAKDGIYELLFQLLCDIIYPVFEKRNDEKDKKLKLTMNKLKCVTPAHMSIPKKYWLTDNMEFREADFAVSLEGFPYGSAIRLLSQIYESHSYSFKLQILSDVVLEIHRDIDAYYRDRPDRPESIDVAADDLLPILSFVMFHANLQRAYTDVAFIHNMLSDKQKNGPSAYSFVSYQAALQFLSGLNAKKMEEYARQVIAEAEEAEKKKAAKKEKAEHAHHEKASIALSPMTVDGPVTPLPTQTAPLAPSQPLQPVVAPQYAPPPAQQQFYAQQQQQQQQPQPVPSAEDDSQFNPFNMKQEPERDMSGKIVLMHMGM